MITRSKIIFIVILTLVVCVAIYKIVTSNTENEQLIQKPENNHLQSTQNESPQIISTKPENLEEAIISATEIVEITFNRPLENAGEFKSRIEPKIEYKVELSGDRKTARIIPAKPYELGATYTLFIGPDSKFDGAGEWRQDKTFHFKTIKYRGV